MNHRYKLILIGITLLIVWKLFISSSTRQPNLPAVIENEVEIQSASGVQTESSAAAAKMEQGNVAFAVFYETLCPDSRGFFINQLLPTVERASDIFTVTLVPYGKAMTQKGSSGYEFQCQHGPVECQGNIVHACATKYVKDQLTLVRYTTCMISDNIDPDDAGMRCARSLSIEWEPIAACSKAEEGKHLLAQMGDATHKLIPPVSFIPTIEVNKNLGYQASLLKRLFEELCSRFKITPQPCKGISTVAYHRL